MVACSTEDSSLGRSGSEGQIRARSSVEAGGQAGAADRNGLGAAVEAGDERTRPRNRSLDLRKLERSAVAFAVVPYLGDPDRVVIGRVPGDDIG